MQHVLNWDNVRTFLLALFAPVENPHRVFDLEAGGLISGCCFEYG